MHQPQERFRVVVAVANLVSKSYESNQTAKAGKQRTTERNAQHIRLAVTVQSSAFVCCSFLIVFIFLTITFIVALSSFSFTLR